MKKPFLNRGRRGFSLIEVTVALGIFGFAIVAILGLMGAAVKSTRDSEERIQASNLSALLLARYQGSLQAVADGTGAVRWNNSVFPQTPGSDTAYKTGLNGGMVDSFGNATADKDDAAFTVKYMTAGKGIGTAAPSPQMQLVNCTVRLEWPVLANKPVNSYTATTSFVISPKK